MRALVLFGTAVLLAIGIWLLLRGHDRGRVVLSDRRSRRESSRISQPQPAAEPTMTVSRDLPSDSPPATHEDNTATEGAPEAPKDQADLERWAREHPDAALAWALCTPNGPERTVVAEIICLEVAGVDPHAAADLVTLLGSDGYVLDNVVQQWALRDLPAAEAYAMRLPPSPDRDRLFDRIAAVRSSPR